MSIPSLATPRLAWEMLPTISLPRAVSSWMETGRGSGLPVYLQLLFKDGQLSNCQAHFYLHKHSLFPSVLCHKHWPFDSVPQMNHGRMLRLAGLPPLLLLPGAGLTHPSGAEALSGESRQPAPAVLC